MNYFTREELEDITKELLENPTRETLKKLNEKYNSSVVEGPVEEKLTVEAAPFINEVTSPVVESPSVPLVKEEMPEVAPTMQAKDVTPVINPSPAFNIPREVPKVENNVSFEMPAFELPKLDTPVVNNQNNEPVNFSGNLFEIPSAPVGNLMQTTDNFNSIPNTMPTTEVPVSPVPFFGPHTDTTSNPIPVGGPINSMPNMGPTMFGQMQQNYM